MIGDVDGSAVAGEVDGFEVVDGYDVVGDREGIGVFGFDVGSFVGIIVGSLVGGQLTRIPPQSNADA